MEFENQFEVSRNEKCVLRFPMSIERFKYMLDRKIYIISDSFIFGVVRQKSSNDDVKLSQNENYFNHAIRISKSCKDSTRGGKNMKGKLTS